MGSHERRRGGAADGATLVSGDFWTMVGWNALVAVLVLVIAWVWLNRERR